MGKKKKNPAPAEGHPATSRGGESEREKRSAEGRLHRKNWKEYTATVEDIERFLSEHVYLRYNVVTGRTEYRMPSLPPSPSLKGEGSDYLQGQEEAEELFPPPSLARGAGGFGWQPLSDRVVNELWRAQSKEKKVNLKYLWQVIESDFTPPFNPFLFYLEHLPPWNGRDDYLLELSLSVNVRGGEEEQLLFAVCLRKWLVAMVASWVDPEVVNHEILILIGEQGSYKTTWFDHLLPPELHEYFRIKTNAAHMTKDDLIVLSQYGLVCYEELDTMRPSELNQLKSAVTARSVDERKPYGRFTEHRPHIASFCGTGNNTQFLTDTTGNRRWLPFEVQGIISPRDAPFNHEGIYAQAYALYRQGFQYWFSQQDIQRIAAHVRHFETPRLESELVMQYFRKPADQEPGEFISVALAMQIVGAGITQKLSTVSLGRAFVEMGFERRTFRNVRGYVVVRRSADEMRSMRHLMAAEARPGTDGERDTDTDDTDVF